MDAKRPDNRNYNSISPSAKALLLIKGLTRIPYAREVAELMSSPEPYDLDLSGQPPALWVRAVHLENRYWSINQLLEDLPVNNILELSSGYSFRGLDMVKGSGVHYIDTDLPAVIDDKKRFIDALNGGEAQSGAGSMLDVLPLNAMDEAAFREVVSHFPDGPLAIVNEGLLMYLGPDEKARICRTIRDILKQRGGYWITADVYLKRQFEDANLQINDPLSRFFQEHDIRENMFDSFEAAEAFFKESGFVIDREAVPDHSKLSLLPQLIASVPEAQMAILQNAGRIQATWQLKVAD